MALEGLKLCIDHTPNRITMRLEYVVLDFGLVDSQKGKGRRKAPRLIRIRSSLSIF